MKSKFLLPIFILLIGLLSIACNVHSSYSIEGESLPIGAKNIEVETKTINLDHASILVDISLPVFSDPKNQEILDQINQRLERDISLIQKNLMNLSEIALKDSEKTSFPFHPYEFQMDYQIHTLRDDFLSVSTLGYEFTGGAHGISPQTTYNYDLNTGKELSLKDLFKEDAPYEEVLNEEIQSQIRKNPEIFFPDEVEIFSGIGEDPSFYIENQQLYLYFNQYEIAPYASGIISFEIPSKVIQPIIASSFIK